MFKVLIPIDDRLDTSIIDNTVQSYSIAQDNCKEEVQFHITCHGDYKKYQSLFSPLKNVVYHYCDNPKCPDRGFQITEILKTDNDDSYVGFMDADDEVSPNFFSELARLSKNKPSSLIYIMMRRNRENGEVYYKPYMDSLSFSKDNLLSGKVANTVTGHFIRQKQLYNLFNYEVRRKYFHESYYGSETFIVQMMLYYAATHSHIVSPNSVYYWNYTPNSLSKRITVKDIISNIHQVDYMYDLMDHHEWLYVMNNIFRTFFKVYFWSTNSYEELNDAMMKVMPHLPSHALPCSFNDPIDSLINSMLDGCTDEHGGRMYDIVKGSHNTTSITYKDKEEFERKMTRLSKGSTPSL